MKAYLATTGVLFALIVAYFVIGGLCLSPS